MFNVPWLSPPVPHKSIALSGASTLNAWLRKARAPPTISSMAAPRIAMAVRMAAIRASLTLPSIMAVKTNVESSVLKLSPAESRP